MRRLTSIGILLSIFFSATAFAFDYRSVNVPRAVLYDVPSANGKKLYIISQFYPVEVIVDLGDWVKVRDKTGGLAWIDSQQLTSERTVLILETADIHSAADTNSAVVFRADKDVVLALAEQARNGWVKVQHRDGLVGYIMTSQVWGV